MKIKEGIIIFTEAQKYEQKNFRIIDFEIKDNFINGFIDGFGYSIVPFNSIQRIEIKFYR